MVSYVTFFGMGSGYIWSKGHPNGPSTSCAKGQTQSNPMTDKADQIVLKILNGTQFGAEVALDPGTYSFGAGDEADLHFADQMMVPLHGTLKVSKGKIELRSEAGALSTTSGLSIAEEDDAWHEIAQLDPIAAGTTRFALGGVDAAWHRLSTEVEAPAIADAGATSATGLRRFAIPAGLAVFAVAFYILATAISGPSGSSAKANPSDADNAAVIADVLSDLSFQHDLSIEVADDGRIAVEGCVADVVQRRAVREALAAASVSVAPRIWAGDTLQIDVDGFLLAQNAPITGTVSLDGDLILSGTLLNQDALENLKELLQREVFGLRDVVDNVRSANTILDEAYDLIDRLRLRDLIILRLDGEIIEATGVVPEDKVDNWVGFIGTYSNTFVEEIPLRTFVSIEGKTPPPPIIIASDSAPPRDAAIDERVIAAEVLADEPTLLTALSEEGAGLDASATLEDVVQVSASADDADQQMSSLLGRVDAAFSADPTRFVALLGLPQTPDNLDEVGALLASAENDPAVLSDLARQLSPDTLTAIAEYVVEIEQQQAPAETAFSFPDIASIANTNAVPNTPLLDFVMGNPSDEFEARNAEVDESRAAEEQVVEQRRLQEDPLVEVDQQLALAVRDALSSSDETTFTSETDEKLAAQLPVLAGPLSEPFARLVRATNLAIAGSDDEMGTTAAELGLPNGTNLLSMSPVLVALVDEQQDALRRGNTVLQATRDGAMVQTCRLNDGVSVEQLPVLLFWMDYFSLNPSIDLAALDGPNKTLFFEVAMSPKRIRRCLEALESDMAAGLLAHSVFLKETAINDRFAEYLFRNVPRFELDMVGINLSEERYVQLRDGSKLRSGMAPNLQSRIAMIGDVGLIVRVADGYEVRLYDETLAWLIESE